jgi:zinc finger CCHC domain-containing protein 8
VEEEIRLLDTRATSRREGDSQGSLGCHHSARGVEATGSDPGVPATDGIVVGPGNCFIVDTTSSIYPSAPFPGHWHSYLYDRIPGITLGEEKDELLPSIGQDLRLCFNCGSPDHAVASCPEPIDRQLVSLSRQFFNFLHPDPIGRETTRFYVAEGWRQQRLEWLRFYEPGAIRGPLLRDALGLQEGDPGNTVEWLRNMAYWGYPPGWVGCRDPRQLVCSRILKDEAEGQVAAQEWESFMIFEGTDDDEEIDLRLSSLRGPLTPSPAASSSTTPVDVEPTRWATYPNTYFFTIALSIYNGTSLDRASSPSRMSVTFTPERRALWERILSGGSGTNNTLSVPPWRFPGAFVASNCSTVEDTVKDFVPPPPSTTPPPLPPTPSSPLPTFTPQKCSVFSRASTPSSRPQGIADVTDDKSVVDMDMSDDPE